MKITFDPQHEFVPSGVVSQIGWDNPELQAAIRAAFNESPREQIVALVIQRESLIARFEPKNSGR
jgi:hypothetical protein